MWVEHAHGEIQVLPSRQYHEAVVSAAALLYHPLVPYHDASACFG